MKTTIFFGFILLALVGACAHQSKELTQNSKIENKLLSVTLLDDSAGINPTELLSIFERLNKAIDSIGYPDAGYKLWQIQGDSIKNFRFMLEGHWPNQAIYDTIHHNKLYLMNWTEEVQKVWGKMKTVSYTRFQLVE